MEERAHRAALAVRILGLADDGGRALSPVARALRLSWGAARPIALEVLQVGAAGRRAARIVRRWCDHDRVDAVLTLGCSGPRREDFAPEMTARLLERALPGIEERIRLAPPVRPGHLLHRGRAGMRRTTLVVNLPEDLSRARAVIRLLAPILTHLLEKAGGGDRECSPPGADR